MQQQHSLHSQEPVLVVVAAVAVSAAVVDCDLLVAVGVCHDLCDAPGSGSDVYVLCLYHGAPYVLVLSPALCALSWLTWT